MAWIDVERSPRTGRRPENQRVLVRAVEMAHACRNDDEAACRKSPRCGFAEGLAIAEVERAPGDKNPRIGAMPVRGIPKPRGDEERVGKGNAFRIASALKKSVACAVSPFFPARQYRQAANRRAVSLSSSCDPRWFDSKIDSALQRDRPLPVSCFHLHCVTLLC